MKKFETSCDMGSIKIFNDSMSCFFDNGLGDLPTTVYIFDPADKEVVTILPHSKHSEFLGHFTVKTVAYLSDYDCEDNAIYTFKPGRWFVQRLDDAIMLIEKEDGDLQA